MLTNKVPPLVVVVLPLQWLSSPTRIPELLDCSSIWLALHCSTLAPILRLLLFVTTPVALSGKFCDEVKSTCWHVLGGNAFATFCSFQATELDKVGQDLGHPFAETWKSHTSAAFLLCLLLFVVLKSWRKRFSCLQSDQAPTKMLPSDILSWYSLPTTCSSSNFVTFTSWSPSWYLILTLSTSMSACHQT